MIAVAMRMLGACRMVSSRGDAFRRKLVEVVVTEREPKIHRQRDQRQPRPKPYSRSKPPHLAHRP